MNDPWTERWNQRYSQPEFAYGEAPNLYLEEQLMKLSPGNILFPAEGEGRNAVYAAKLGWKVSAFDISNEGKNKALLLATKNNVSIDYLVGKLEELPYTQRQFDAIALIYAHFPSTIKSNYHKILSNLLRVGGLLIFEAFSKSHLDNIAADERTGGPRDINMLFSIEEIKTDFPQYEILELVEKEIELNEGPFHQGKGSVIRFVGKKG